ncbi:Uncharacterised protein [Oligella urethralis]|uniref:hypothetical protein n=1 Tax=Oligella urethralis TaxID=90245 RepID=UPI000E04558D|nr:hypothetical protein [Oligella urethralis]SUA64788.1 Uncharacterised protein [Oligella urethralis]
MPSLMRIETAQRVGIQEQASSLLALDKIIPVSEATDLRAGMDTLRTKAIQRFGQVAR